MQPLEKRAQALKEAIDQAMARLDVAGKAERLQAVDAQLAIPEVWNNPAHAQELSKHSAGLRAVVEPWQTLQAQVADIVELMQMGDESMQAEFDSQLTALEAELAQKRLTLRWPLRRPRRDPAYYRGCRRYRRAGLGRNAGTYVPTMGRKSRHECHDGRALHRRRSWY